MRCIQQEAPESIEAALDVLREGGVIVYPTETAYGLGVDATNPQAVEKIFNIKMRDKGKPLPVIVADKGQADEYAIFPLRADALVHAYWPGPLTLVVPARNRANICTIHTDGTVSMRVPGSAWCQSLCQKLGRPITSTSANAAGAPPEYALEGVQKSLGESIPWVDLWIDGGILSGGAVSTVISLVDEIELLREGAISGEDIKKVIR
jgi:L-threonylcarbamoyladenylate synthase